MVHYYAHKRNNSSQWLKIDKRLGILLTSLKAFQYKCSRCRRRRGYLALVLSSLAQHTTSVA
ncbi:hypothetical protein PCASD_00017 [Puccinia coronata f. sp. avenae]|uniref:Uncharacterized protein n=1 Tax=Puccinia coronata f. sp. avenae TaxID=200324 RepID=A0A2N5VQL3_9BASI|nr:hypothetical protein PCASD_00017 [Puccinia coronata f. sp. avenae]